MASAFIFHKNNNPEDAMELWTAQFEIDGLYGFLLLTTVHSSFILHKYYKYYNGGDCDGRKI